MIDNLLMFFGGYTNDFSVNFDGVNDFVTAGTSATFKNYHGASNTSAFAFTISVWVKFDNPNANAFQVIFDSCNAVTANVGVTLALDSRAAVPRSRSIQAYIYRGVGGTAVVQSVSANNIYPNSTGWNHIIWTYNQALVSSNSNIYINNVLLSTTNKTGQTPSTANASSALRFGITTGGAAQMAGNLFNAFFADGVITTAERATLYANPKANPRSLITSCNITNAYNFPSGQANFPTWVDLVGGINGTMTNQTSSNIQNVTP